MHRILQQLVHAGQTQVSANLEQEQTHPQEHSGQGLKGSNLQELILQQLRPVQPTRHHRQQMMFSNGMQQHVLGCLGQTRQPLVQQIQPQLQHSMALSKILSIMLIVHFLTKSYKDMGLIV